MAMADQVPSVSHPREDCADLAAVYSEVQQMGKPQESQSPYTNMILEGTGLSQPMTADQHGGKVISKEHFNTTTYCSVPATRGQATVSSKTVAKGSKGHRPKNTSIEWL